MQYFFIELMKNVCNMKKMCIFAKSFGNGKCLLTLSFTRIIN